MPTLFYNSWESDEKGVDGGAEGSKGSQHSRQGPSADKVSSHFSADYL